MRLSAGNIGQDYCRPFYFGRAPPWLRRLGAADATAEGSACCAAAEGTFCCPSTGSSPPAVAAFLAGIPYACVEASAGGAVPLELEPSPSLGSGAISPSAWRTSALMSSPASSGPKPAMAPGSVKSHWFSAMPMKSRMAGSLVQARRSAALVSSAGTPDCRKARISLAAVMLSSGGRLARSMSAAGASRRGSGAGGPSAAWPRWAAGRAPSGSACLWTGSRSRRLSRDQRAKNRSERSSDPVTTRSPPRGGASVGEPLRHRAGV
jgi:hypothetical protein